MSRPGDRPSGRRFGSGSILMESNHQKQDLEMAQVEVVPVDGHWRAPRIIRDSPLTHAVERRFKDVLKYSNRLRVLVQHLDENGAEYCVYGGWLRDNLSSQITELDSFPRDIDIVERGLEVEQLLSYLPSDVSRTIFGGVHSREGGLPFDVWPLHETFLIKRLCLPPTFENLLHSTDFNINAGVFFPKSRLREAELIDGGMLDAIRDRVLAFNANLLPFPVIQCARLAAYAGKLSLTLTPAVQAFMSEIVADARNYQQVLLGLSEYYPPETYALGRQVLERLKEGLHEDSIF